MTPVLAADSTTAGGSWGAALLGLAFLFLIAFWASRIAKRKFRSQALFGVLGFFFGFFGVIAAALTPAKKGPQCISCGTRLQLMWVQKRPFPARVCLACG